MVNTKTKELLVQFSKFVLVGVINTGIDIGVLNLLMWVSGHDKGVYYSVFKAISFTVAVINSYLMNKFWTFKERQTNNVGSQFTSFFFISLIGFGINVGVASLVVNILPQPNFISGRLWANFGALCATGVALVWNFIGYKVFVFKNVSPRSLSQISSPKV